MMRKSTAIVNSPGATPSIVHWREHDLMRPDMAAKNSTEANATVSRV